MQMLTVRYWDQLQENDTIVRDYGGGASGSMRVLKIHPNSVFVIETFPGWSSPKAFFITNIREILSVFRDNNGWDA